MPYCFFTVLWEIITQPWCFYFEGKIKKNLHMFVYASTLDVYEICEFAIPERVQLT